jgi:hypothetical protein
MVVWKDSVTKPTVEYFVIQRQIFGTEMQKWKAYSTVKSSTEADLDDITKDPREEAYEKQKRKRREQLEREKKAEEEKRERRSLRAQKASSRSPLGSAVQPAL